MKISCSLCTLTSQCSPLKSTLKCTKDLSCLVRRPEVIDQSNWFLPTTELASKTVIYFWNWLNTVMQVSISSKTIPPKTNPQETTRREQKPSPEDHCVQKPSPHDRTGNQKPHPRDLELVNFTNISINSFTIWNEKLCGLNKLNGFSIRRLIIKVYIIWWSPESKWWTCKSFIWYV